jgi:imidazolonepropionase-like amidohydrolase
METQYLTIENAAILARAGVKVAIKSDEVYGVGSLSELTLTAALAVKGGLDRETAIRAITLTPAEIFGVEDRIGSLQPGKDADIAIFSGEPLDYLSVVERVLIDGKTVFESGNAAVN